jgi:hypothetical protein
MDHASLILGVIAVLELVVIIIGSAWSIGRDMWIRRQSQLLAEKLGDVTEAIEKVGAYNDRITDKLRSSDEVTREHRRELLELLRDQKRENNALILDVERRTQECIRQFHFHERDGGGGSMNVHFNRDAQQTQIGDGNKQS